MRVKAKRSTRKKTNPGQEAKKQLCVRYAEIMRLRQSIIETQSAKQERDSHPASK
jgi:hypothetical protein